MGHVIFWLGLSQGLNAASNPPVPLGCRRRHSCHLAPPLLLKALRRCR